MRISNRGKVLLLSATLMAGVAVYAQQSTTPVAKPELPSIDVAATFAAERSQVVPSQCCFWFKGGGVDAAYTFWKGLSVAASLTGDHASNISSGIDANKLSFLGGPRYTWTAPEKEAKPRLQVFAQSLFGGAHGFNGAFPDGNGLASSANSFALEAGGGLNLIFHKGFGLRLAEAEFVHTSFGNSMKNSQDDLRLAAGITWHHELAPPPAVKLGCSAEPASIYPGDPVTATAVAAGVEPKANVIYVWSGVNVTGNGASIAVATANLAPGAYTVKATVKEGKPGKEGLKPWESASCSASFTVKALEVPKAAAAPPPPPKEEAAPAPLPAPTAVKYGAIEFSRDLQRPTRVDNEAKAELDRFADALAAAPDARVVVLGYASAGENKEHPGYAALRAVNTKDYLSREKGIDPARIELRIGNPESTGKGKMAELWIVPAGAKFSSEGSVLVNESKVKAVPRTPLKPRHHKKAEQTTQDKPPKP
ncbi:MAG: OmpA family protein [Candidatus Korobacteraceae bacterium]|jgi:outer membrane protein OmpA-like peptidoglycan-associated protein